MTMLERLYFTGYSIKKHYKLKNQKTLPCSVVSIGNITLGGTGKTPATIELARKAQGRGFKPCILTRGYGGTAKALSFVSTGDAPLLDENHAGDEAYLMAVKLKGIPIVKGKNRYEAGMFALNNLSGISRPDLFIMDDGFQHWGLCRDKDILLIDSINPFGNRKLLPLGILREPLRGIENADIIVITKKAPMMEAKITDEDSATDNLIAEIRNYNRKAPVFCAFHKPLHFTALHGEHLPLQWAEGKSFYGFCGIGNPLSFQQTLISAGVRLTGLRTFRDHYRYSQQDMKTIIEDARGNNSGWIVTTEKDIMRLEGLDMPKNLVSLGIEFRIDERFYHEVFTGIKNKKE